MSDPIQEAIERSKVAAAASAVALPNSSTAVTSPAPTPVKLSMEQMMAGGMSVDKWIKVTEDGIKLGDSKLITGFVPATLDTTEGTGFILKYTIKGGNPAVYKSTTDMSLCTTGGTWEDACNSVRKLDPSATPYRCVDLPFTLTSEVKDVSGAVVGAVGDIVGYSTPTTNWANWVSFFKEVSDAGLVGQVVPLNLSAQPRSNKNANVWGVLKMNLILQK